MHNTFLMVGGDVPANGLPSGFDLFTHFVPVIRA